MGGMQDVVGLQPKPFANRINGCDGSDRPWHRCSNVGDPWGVSSEPSQYVARGVVQHECWFLARGQHCREVSCELLGIGGIALRGRKEPVDGDGDRRVFTVRWAPRYKRPVGR